VTFVYAVQAQASRCIKIGIAKDPVKRLAALQTGNHESLELLGFGPGDAATEARLHAELAHYREIGEWFRDEPAVITALGKHFGLDRRIPTPQMVESAQNAATLRRPLAGEQ
jgi:hypothetical protein